MTLLEYSATINNQIPLWSLVVAGGAGLYFVIHMNFKIVLLEKEFKAQGEKLDDIKKIVYALLTPEQKKEK